MSKAMTDVADDCCTLCLEPLTRAARVRLPCGHDVFCGQCLVTWQLHDTRCPICRHDNAVDTTVEGSDANADDNADELLFVRRTETRKQALKQARKDARHDPRLKARLERAKEWQKKAKAFRAEYKRKKAKLDAAEDVLMQKLCAHDDRLRATFHRKWGEYEKDVKELKKQARLAKGYANLTNNALVRKYRRALFSDTAQLRRIA